MKPAKNIPGMYIAEGTDEVDYRLMTDKLATPVDDWAGNLLNLVQNNTTRIESLEAVLFNDITANPFLILFDNLDGVSATGVWNDELQRIEC